MKQFFLLLLCLSSISLYAQDNRCVAQLDSTEIMLAQKTKLSVKLLVPHNQDVIFPDNKTGFLKDFDILETPTCDTIFQDSDFTELLCTYYITRFEPGSISFRAGPYSMFEHDTVWSNPLTLSIQMPVVDTTRAINDIKPIKLVTYTWRDWAPKVFLILIICIVSVLLVVFIKRYWKNRPIVEKPQKKVVQLSPNERALQAIDELEQKQLCAQHKYKQHYTELFDILRLYFEEVLSVQLFEKTSDEMLAELSATARLSVQQLNDLRAFADESDLVKFAKHTPNKQSVDVHMSIARSLICVADVVVSES